MNHESICSHAELNALQTRPDELFVNLVSLESVRIALESYALLRPPPTGGGEVMDLPPA